MDIKELDKKQLVLLTLLITFVVSIATGIVTVSLMNQMPKSVPQTINNVIQRTIEKVTTVEVPTSSNNQINKEEDTEKNSPGVLLGSDDSLISIYLKSTDTTVLNTEITNENVSVEKSLAIGQGIIVSDVGLILIDSNLIKDDESYKVILNKTEFSLSVLKKFDNGFTVLKISTMTNDTIEDNSDTTTVAQ